MTNDGRDDSTEPDDTSRDLPRPLRLDRQSMLVKPLDMRTLYPELYATADAIKKMATPKLFDVRTLYPELCATADAIKKMATPKLFDVRTLYPELYATADAIKKMALPSRLSAFGAKVPNTAIFGSRDTAPKIARLNTPPAGRTEALDDGSLPSANLYGVEGLSLKQIAELARSEGICLLHVPRAAIVKEIVDAEDVVVRRRVLREHADGIFDDCADQLDMCVRVELSGFVPAMRQAIGAARAGFTMPAQALAASVIDSVLNLVHDEEHYKMVKWFNRGKRRTANLDDMDRSSGLIFSALWQVYMSFWPRNGDPIPASFARNASAHAVDPVQFTRANAVHAIMLGTSLLRFTNDLRTEEELVSMGAA